MNTVPSLADVMPTNNENLLENGIWEEIKPELKPPPYARAAKWCIDLVRPSILSKSGGPRPVVRRTAYLDGLRGFAAFMVYWHHNQLWAHDGMTVGRPLENAFGYDNKYYFACMHGVRTFFTGGHIAVALFFVISGYVLSSMPIALLHAGEHVKLGDNLGSALFRRWLRLYIPVICTTFIYMTSWHAFGIWTNAKHQANYRDELWNWYTEFKNFSFVFDSGSEPWFSYNVHTWSIPVEFMGSLVVYTSLMAFSRCTRNARLWCEAGLIFYFMYIANGWFCALFVAGMLLCDLDMLASNNDLPRIFWKLEPFKELIFFNLFIIGIFLGGVPSHDSDIQTLRDSPGWYYLSFLKPQAVFDYKWFYLFWAAVFLVASIQQLPWLKSFFEMRFNQYLGRISFALYLVHGPVLWALGDRVYAAVGWERESHPDGIPEWINKFPLPKTGPLGLELAFLVPHLILLPVTLWTAEMVTRFFDQPSLKFSKWLYGKTLARPAVKL